MTQRRPLTFALALLADLLLSNHGLTLQANKTHVMPVDRFLDRHSTPEVQAGLENLSERVTSVLADLGLTPYDVVINAKLSNEEMVRVQELSLIDLLRTEMDAPTPNLSRIRTYVSFIGQLGVPRRR